MKTSLKREVERLEALAGIGRPVLHAVFSEPGALQQTRDNYLKKHNVRPEDHLYVFGFRRRRAGVADG